MWPKKILKIVCALYISGIQTSMAQSGTWIWMTGSNTGGSLGTYGIQGVASPDNTPPALYQAAQWTDKQGNFWIYGGESVDSSGHIVLLSDLWKFDPLTAEWTWVNGKHSTFVPASYGNLGISSPANTPGARIFGYPTWTDNAGDLWLFGGYIASGNITGVNGFLNDLWKYSIASNEWTWMGGPAVVDHPGVYGSLGQSSASFIPPPREDANACWTDANNNLWLYGGDSLGIYYGDLWRYSISSGEWAWMGGTRQNNALPVYGTLGVENAFNQPGGRTSHTHWTDGNYLYLSCGQNDSNEVFDDVWRFNLSTNYWTWVAGYQGNVTSGQYTQYCTTTDGDVPIGRWGESSAQVNTCSSLLFMWGGFNQSYSKMNDLWNFDLPSQQWKWVSGTNDPSPAGSYGSPGVSSPANVPAGAGGSCMWSDVNGNLWLFGGTSDPGILNAMWEYIPDAGCFPGDTGIGTLTFQLSSATICAGDSAQISFSGDSGITISPASNVIWLDSLHATIWADTTTEFTTSGYTPCGAYSMQVFTLTVTSGTVNIKSNKPAICPGASAIICAPPGFVSYLWNVDSTTMCINALSAGDYYVTVTGNNGCRISSNHISISALQAPSVNINQSGDTLSGYNDSTYLWFFNGAPIDTATSSVFIASVPGSYVLQVTDTNGCTATSNPIIITGIENQSAQNSISVFPNPSSSGWNIIVTRELVGVKTELYDATGRIIFQSVISNLSSIINVPGIAKGVYQLRITGPGFKVEKKLVAM